MEALNQGSVVERPRPAGRRVSPERLYLGRQLPLATLRQLRVVPSVWLHNASWSHGPNMASCASTNGFRQMRGSPQFDGGDR